MKRNVIFRGTTPTLEIRMGRGIKVENIDLCFTGYHYTKEKT